MVVGGFAKHAVTGALMLGATSLFSAGFSTAADARRAPHHHAAHRRYAYRQAHVIQCVAFARADTGIALSGNAANWWDNAQGVYARGSTPEIGSVLNFRATAGMRLGHVAVVREVIGNRLLRIDQSHWNSSGISRDVQVVDVSPDNDWSAVRVELGHGDAYGGIYPTYGFIYPRPDQGVTLAAAGAAAPRRHEIAMEVAEAPSSRGINLATPGIVDDARPVR